MTGTFDRHFFHWIGVVGVTVLCLWLQGDWKWLSEYPGDWVVPVSDWLNAIMDWIVKYSGWFFLGVSWVLEWPIDAVRVVLNALPWSVTTFVVCVVAYLSLIHI